MIAGALHIPNVRYPRLCPKSVRKTGISQLEYGEAKQSAPSWKLCGNDGYAARLVPEGRRTNDYRCLGHYTQSLTISAALRPVALPGIIIPSIARDGKQKLHLTS